MSIEFFAKTAQGWLVRPNIEVMKFPGGEVHVKYHDTYDGYQEHYCIVRGANLDDYIAAQMWSQIIESFDPYTPHYFFAPYLPGARADHDVTHGLDLYVKIVIGVMAKSIFYLDPHNAEALWRLKRGADFLGEIDFVPVLKQALVGRSGLRPEYDGIIAPDAGAKDRAERAGAALNLPVYYASKRRDQDTGKLSGFYPPVEWNYAEPVREELGPTVLCSVVQPQIFTSVPPSDGRYLVVDDICDGGGTFMGLASVLNIPRERLDLWVTHGVFSGNAGQLTEAYGNIFTTDSHPGCRNPEVGARVSSLLPYFYQAIKEEN